MAIAAGVDGCRGGWLIVRRYLDKGTADFSVVRRWHDLPKADMIAVDMPIGLPDSGPRGCDKLARARLGPRRASVFLGLRRPLLDFETYAFANDWGKSDGAGLSKQAWNLIPKIRELDAAITPRAQARVRETHPELAFLALNGAPLSYAKRKPEGVEERLVLLRANGFPRIRNWRDIFSTEDAGIDDLLDACALSLSAERMLKGEGVRLPDDPPRDARGLSMEIWY